jgi:neutral ceramidase
MPMSTVSSLLMHRVHGCTRFLLGLLGAGWLAGAALAGAELRVGRAKVVITPPAGSVMGNSYGISVVTGVTSNVHAKAVVFETAEGKAAIVACDLISLHGPIVARARALIAEKTGVPPDRVMLAATHCHASAQTHPLLYSLAGEAAQKLSEAYVERLPGLIAESVRLAEADLQPAKLFAGAGSEDSISFNRRFLLRDGTVKTNPGGNPDKVRPMGPIDPQVGVVYIESADRKPLVTIVNFALHVAVVGGSQISSDYPHTLAETLGRVKGDAMLTVFLNGMSGNINHLNPYASSGLRAEAEAARIGTILAAAVLKTYPKLRPVEAAPLRAVSRAVRVPVLAAPDPQRLAAAQATLRRHGKGATFPEVIRAWRDIDLAVYGAAGTWASEVQAIVFGRDLALVGYPGDSFVELGLAMKQNSPFALTFVSEQSANGAISYIPNEKAFPEGSYEVDSARVAPGGGEVLATAAIRLLTELFPRP